MVQLLWEIAAAFGKPVVPLVGVSNAMVSSVSKSVGLKQFIGIYKYLIICI